MTSLFVRLDPVLALRQTGGLDPEPAAAAALAELAGADGISVVCGREAGRVQERDIRLLREMVRGVLNLGLPPADEFVKLALAIRPDLATFVPEAGEGVPVRGLDVEDRRAELGPMVAALQGAGIGTAVLLDASPVQVKAAQRAGVGTVLLHTGRLVWAAGTASRATEYENLVNAAKVAHRLGLTVHAGGGLSYQNLRPVALLPEVEAVHVGHALVARALLTGMPDAVREMLRVLACGRDP
jgi:pyridoxine 5-phosphate synthase